MRCDTPGSVFFNTRNGRSSKRGISRENSGTVLGQLVSPIESVGLYVPGGKAAYPSSVLMSAVLATVAGVPRIVMVTPPLRGEANPLLLAAAELCGLDRSMVAGWRSRHSGAGFGHADHRAGSQDRRSGERLCGRGKAADECYRRRGHAGRTFGNPDYLRRRRTRRLGCRGSAFPSGA